MDQVAPAVPTLVPNATWSVQIRANGAHPAATDRWVNVVGIDGADDLDDWARRFATTGRVTLNFHPDRVTRAGTTVASGLRIDGRYRSQWSTGISNGSRSAMPGGDRHSFEQRLFDGAYAGADPDRVEMPVYGAFDLLRDPHGGSPRFGSCYVVLADSVRSRTTLCLGDSNLHPSDVGTFDSPWSILAGLAEQAGTGRLLDRPLDLGDLRRVLAGAPASAEPARCVDGYIEAQVHGGVDLRRDVEAIVLDPSFAGTEVEDEMAAAAVRYGFALRWHGGSELEVERVPHDFRGPTMPGLARRIAGAHGVIDACAIGRAARGLVVGEPLPGGDAADSAVQQLKYLWHTLLVHGRDRASA